MGQRSMNTKALIDTARTMVADYKGLPFVLLRRV
jgi:hypothetical protein